MQAIVKEHMQHDERTIYKSYPQQLKVSSYFLGKSSGANYTMCTWGHDKRHFLF
uniref:Uncharacterized protein n=1 Tax=Arundo donax TaxID=35708 RepID=A0A0A9G0E5_ARUDO